MPGGREKLPATDGRADMTAEYVFTFIAISSAFDMIHSYSFTALSTIGTKINKIFRINKKFHQKVKNSASKKICAWANP